MSPNSRVTNLERFHNDDTMMSMTLKRCWWQTSFIINIKLIRSVPNIRHQHRILKTLKKVRQVTQTSIVSIGENFCDRLGTVILCCRKKFWYNFIYFKNGPSDVGFGISLKRQFTSSGFVWTSSRFSLYMRPCFYAFTISQFIYWHWSKQNCWGEFLTVRAFQIDACEMIITANQRSSWYHQFETFPGFLNDAGIEKVK